MKKNKIITIITVSSLVAIIVVKLAMNNHTINQREEDAVKSQLFDAIPVKTAAVKQQEINDQIVLSGTFAPQQDLKLVAQAQGQIRSMLVKKTQFVNKGTLLATIDNSSLKSQLTTAQASLDKTRVDAQP